MLILCPAVLLSSFIFEKFVCVVSLRVFYRITLFACNDNFNSSLPSWVPFVSHLIAEWHTLIYCGFVASFEMRMCELSNFVLFQSCF